MAITSKKRFEGELMIRAGEGLKDIPELPDLRAGMVYHCATISCCHCRSVYILNEKRIRPREYCRTCDEYLCDVCHAVRSRPGYVHRSFEDLSDAVRSGKYVLSGPVSEQVLIPLFTES